MSGGRYTFRYEYRFFLCFKWNGSGIVGFCDSSTVGQQYEGTTCVIALK